MFASPSVGNLFGGADGGRTISESQATGPRSETPQAEVDIHNVPELRKHEKHEANGTSMAHLEVEEASIASRQVLRVDLVDGPIQFTVGPNAGAQLLESEMSRPEGCRLLSLDTDRWGKVTCYDDTS